MGPKDPHAKTREPTKENSTRSTPADGVKRLPLRSTPTNGPRRAPPHSTPSDRGRPQLALLDPERPKIKAITPLHRHYARPCAYNSAGNTNGLCQLRSEAA